MIALRTKKATPDRSKIALEHPEEARHWAKHFDVSEETLRQAVEKVGNAAAAVRKELRSQQGLPPDDC
ncbi:MAG: DUF3606 domain-containing protein [Xanthobacteraceae bacterium]